MEKQLFSPRNPLAVIALLVGAVESIMGAAAALLDPGHAQNVLVYAMVGIFGVVIIGFFAVLYHHPAHFYSPEQFHRETAHVVFTGKEKSFAVVDTRMRKAMPETELEIEADPSTSRPETTEASQ